MTPRELENASVPELQNGDRLTVDEFIRRAEAMGEDVRAELVEGIVFMGSPVGEPHSSRHTSLVGWALVYATRTPGVLARTDASVRLPGPRNLPQPDLHLRLAPEVGGSSTVVGKLLTGAPELVAEVSDSSVSLDLHAKLRAYRRAGVTEYLVVLVQEREVRWHVLRGRLYERLFADDAGIVKSLVFPGLWLDTRALLEDRPADLLATGDRGIASEEHAAFLKELDRRRAARG